MGTRAVVVVQDEIDGKAKALYRHYDGYPENMLPEIDRAIESSDSGEYNDVLKSMIRRDVGKPNMNMRVYDDAGWAYAVNCTEWDMRPDVEHKKLKLDQGSRVAKKLLRGGWL